MSGNATHQALTRVLGVDLIVSLVLATVRAILRDHGFAGYYPYQSLPSFVDERHRRNEWDLSYPLAWLFVAGEV